MPPSECHSRLFFHHHLLVFSTYGTPSSSSLFDIFLPLLLYAVRYTYHIKWFSRHSAISTCSVCLHSIELIALSNSMYTKYSPCVPEVIVDMYIGHIWWWYRLYCCKSFAPKICNCAYNGHIRAPDDHSEP